MKINRHICAAAKTLAFFAAVGGISWAMIYAVTHFRAEVILGALGAILLGMVAIGIYNTMLESCE